MSFEIKSEIVELNVGGTYFSTSQQTLSWIPDTFFTSLLSGRIPSLKDSKGAIFIDRDPIIFSHILNYLRTKDIQTDIKDYHALKLEAEFYGISPLVRRLILCEGLQNQNCGGMLFHAIIQSPANLQPEFFDTPSEGFSPPSSKLVCENVFDTRLRAKSNVSEIGFVNMNYTSKLSEEHPQCVTCVKANFNWLVVTFRHKICLYKLKESIGWNLTWTSKHIGMLIEKVALNSKHPCQDGFGRMVAICHGTYIQMWLVSDSQHMTKNFDFFNLNVSVDFLFFIGCHLVAISMTGTIGIWHANTQNWQIQDVGSITCYDTSGSLLLFGCENGSIFIIDMQKFPLRMKDNDLLITELFKDPTGDKITSLSVYLTSKSGQLQFSGFLNNWMEIAYGTNSGMVRIIVQHPETLGQGPQLFQSFMVHRSPIVKIMISEKYLVSVCQDLNHVRTWSLTRFRGMINTQPGSMPLTSFKIFTIGDINQPPFYTSSNDCGPFGEKDDQQIFVQKVVSNSDQLFVRLSSSGKRLCVVKSVDGSMISSFTVHECEGSNRIGSRSRRFLFTGHQNGTVQIWDLSTAFELSQKETETESSGLTVNELMKILDQCELNTQSASNNNSTLHLPITHSEAFQISNRKN